MNNRTNNRNKGFTGIELLTAVAILVIVFVFSYLAFNLISRNMNKTVQNSMNQSDMNIIHQKILKSVHNSTWEGFINSGINGIYYYGDKDYRHPLLLQSFLNEDGSCNIDTSLNPVCTGYTLYYIVRPKNDICAPELNPDGSPVYDEKEKVSLSANPDTYCPHKLLIKKELGLADINHSMSIYDQLRNHMTNSGTGKTVAKNVLNFEIIPPEDGSKYTVYYNGKEKKVNDKLIKVKLTAFTERKYLNKAHFNEDLLNDTANLFILEDSAEPQN
ncbi:MAG: type II secretion system protein [Armatimonadota bacterium]